MAVIPLRTDAPQNAFRHFWNLGWRRLLPLYPADAQIENAHDLSEATLNQRLGKAPAQRLGNGQWVNLKGWSSYRATEQDIDRWHAWGANVGMVLDDDWFVFDIDIQDAQWADEAERIITGHLGEAPCRIGLAPKRMLFYRMTEPFPMGAPIYATTRNGEEKIELFGKGRNVAIYGTHRKAGRAMAWPRQPIAADMLPRVTQTAYEACCAAIVAALPGGTRSRTHEAVDDREAIDQSTLRAKHTGTLRSAVEAIRNTRKDFGGYDDWVRLAAAIRGAVGEEGFYDGEAMFVEFSERSDIHDMTESPERVYRSVQPPFGVGAGYVYDLALRHGWNDPCALASEFFEPVIEVEPSPFDIQAMSESTEAADPIDFQPWGERDLTAIPYPEFVYSDFYARGYTSVTLAPPKVGKSMLGLAEAVDMATGRGFLTGTPRAPLRVVYYNAEDDQAVIDSRVAALLMEYGIGQHEIAETLYPVSGVTRDDFFMVSGAEPVINEALFQGLERFVARVGADVLIFDPLQDLSRSPETNDVFRLLGQRLRRMAASCGVALGLIHHTRKLTPGVAPSIDDGRGGSALRGTARFNRLLIGMSEDEAAKAGVDNHRRFMRVADMESNLAPPSSDVNRWFEKSAVVIPNGKGVGVIRPWEWPSAGESVSPADIARVQAEVKKAMDPYRADPRSSRWVGSVVAATLDLDLSQKASKERVKAIIAAWVKDDILRMSETHDARAGRYVQTIVCGRSAPTSATVFD